MMSEPTDVGADEILSEVAADDYYAIIPEWVLFHADLSHGAVRLYGVLRRFADHRGVAFPGLSAIGKKYGVEPRSVTRHMDELIAAGAVTKKRRVGGNGKVTSNLYRVHSRPTFVQVKHDYTPDTSAAVAAVKAQADAPGGVRTKMSDGSTDKDDRRSTDKNVRLTTAITNHSQDEPQGSAALRAATATTPVETSSSNLTSGNARGRDDAAAAESSADDVPGDASRAGIGPAAILEAMMLNPDEAARFRAWLVTATNATNPDGLIVTLNGSGRLSERLTQWRTSEDTPGIVNGPTGPRVVHLEWCGRCDRTTRTASVTDLDGREYVRRCPTCNIHAGRPAAGSGASQEIAQQVALAAANSTGGGRDAAAAARAALPQGVGRRITMIGTPVDVATLRTALGAVQ